MPSVASFTANPTSVPNGGVSRLKVVFNLAPGEPGRTLAGRLHDPDGLQVASVTVQEDGIPAEQEPVVQIGPSPGSYYIEVDDGTLSRVTGNTFDWQL